MGRKEDIDKHLKDILSEIEPDPEPQTTQKRAGNGNNINIGGDFKGDIHINEKKKRRPVKTAAMIGGSIIIALTITIHANVFKKTSEYTVSKNLATEYKKNPDVFTRAINYPSEVNYTTDLNFPDYLDEVSSMDASPEFESLTDL